MARQGASLPKIWHAKEQADVSLEKYGTPRSKSVTKYGTPRSKSTIETAKKSTVLQHFLPISL